MNVGTMQRLLALALLVTVIVFTRAGSASACSCAQLDPTVAIAQSEAAFVGTYTGEVLGGANPNIGQVFYLFEVEQWVKGDLGSPVAVRSSASGASCGFETPPGQRVGVVLTMDNGTPTGGLCSVASAEAMLAALKPIQFDGSGPPVYIVANAGRPAIQFLDADGGLVGGIEDGGTVSVCPGDRVIAVGGGQTITVYDLSDLEIVRTFDVSDVSQIGYTLLACHDVGGEEITLAVTSWNSGLEPESWVTTAGDLAVRLMQGAFLEVQPAADGWVGLGNHTVVFTTLDGQAIQLHGIEKVDPPISLRSVVSPSGTKVAVSEYHPDGFSKFYVYDISGGLLHSIGPRPLGDISAWLDDETVLISSYLPEASEPTWIQWSIESQTITEATTLPPWGFRAVGDRLIAVEGAELVSLATSDFSDRQVLRTFTVDGAWIVGLLSDAVAMSPSASGMVPISQVTVPAVTLASPTATSPPTQRPGLLAVAGAAMLVGLGLVAWRRRHTGLP